MKKAVFKFIFFVSVLSTLSYLVYNVILKSQEKITVAKRLQTVPKFSLFNLDNTLFTNTDILIDKAIVFIYFNSECDFCRNEAQSIQENLKKLKTIHFVFVSTEPVGTIENFSKRYDLQNQSNITFLHDANGLFYRQFDVQSIPYILIYNRNKELIKKHNGQLNASGILKAFERLDTPLY